MKLVGKTALITGGTSGMGLATAKLFVNEGARVAVTGRNDAQFAAVRAELGKDALIIKADVRSLDAMQAVSRQVAEDFGGLDVFFGNAGKAAGGLLADTREATYDEIMDINVKGVFFSMQAVAPIIRNGGSVILNTSFIVHKPMLGLTLLAASKAAVRALAHGWAREFLERNIRINTVCPGYIDTPLHDKVGGTPEEVNERKALFAKTVPVGRMGQPDDIAHAVLFLASDESKYIVGTEIIVDGGMSRL